MKSAPGAASIMIVDDEPENLNLLEDMLRRKGWAVQAFPSGQMAFAAAEEERPDLILLDIQMPGMDGYEVCRRFKADARLRLVPIIFLSAFTEAAFKVRAFEAGGVDFVTKPFAEIEVLARTQTHLQLSRRQLQLETLVHQRVGELAEAHRRLCIWDDAKTQWLNMLSHEMRTPLTGVFATAEILFRNLPPDSPFHDLKNDYALARLRIEKLIDDALTLAQIDISAGRPDLKPARLAHLLQRAVAVVSRQVPDISILTCCEDVEGVTILGDSQLLNRAFIDLLSTLAQCAREGETLTLDAHVHDGVATLELATNGSPLSADALETFFDIGGQRMLLKQGGDFGLGAALASRIIRLFEGRVSIRNGPERGILVQASLPLDATAHDRKAKR